MIPLAIDITMNLGYNTLVIFMAIIVFSFAHYKDGFSYHDKIIKVTLFFIDSFLFMVAGFIFIGPYVHVGTICFILSAFASFAGLAYSLALRLNKTQ